MVPIVMKTHQKQFPYDSNPVAGRSGFNPANMPYENFSPAPKNITETTNTRKIARRGY
jgi:hypothetical protein